VRILRVGGQEKELVTFWLLAKLGTIPRRGVARGQASGMEFSGGWWRAGGFASRAFRKSRSRG